jgi:hypothetical protein
MRFHQEMVYRLLPHCKNFVPEFSSRLGRSKVLIPSRSKASSYIGLQIWKICWPRTVYVLSMDGWLCVPVGHRNIHSGKSLRTCVFREYFPIFRMVRSLLCVRFPGNPDDDDYMNRLPPPQPAALQAIGLCTRTLVPSNPDENRLRSFELRTTVYDRSSTDNHTTSFCVRCYLPAGPRFAATPVPERNALMSVAGEIIGVHEESGVIAILLHELIFLSARGQKRSGATDPNATSSPATPRKKRAWDAWGSRSGQKGKRPVLESSSPAPAGSSQDPLPVEDGE